MYVLQATTWNASDSARLRCCGACAAPRCARAARAERHPSHHRTNTVLHTVCIVCHLLWTISPAATKRNFFILSKDILLYWCTEKMCEIDCRRGRERVIDRLSKAYSQMIPKLCHDFL